MRDAHSFGHGRVALRGLLLLVALGACTDLNRTPATESRDAAAADDAEVERSDARVPLAGDAGDAQVRPDAMGPLDGGDLDAAQDAGCSEQSAEARCGATTDCGALSSPLHGDVVVSATTVDATATYRCQPRYVLVGKGSRNCGADGAWSDAAPSCVDACVDGLQLSELDVGSASFVVIENTAQCTAQLTGVHLALLSSSGAVDAFTFDEGSLASGASTVLGEAGSGYDYLIAAEVSGSASGTVMLCAAEACNAEHVLDAISWHVDVAPPALPPGVTLDAPLRGMSATKQQSERFFRVGARGAAPDFRSCDWIVAGGEPLFAENFECGDFTRWSSAGGSFRTSSGTPDGSGYSLEQYEGSGTSLGVYRNFAGGLTPSRISFWMRGVADAWTSVLGCRYSTGPCEAVANTSFWIAFDGISAYDDSHKRIQAVYGGGAFSVAPMAVDTWFLVELRDIDWQSGHFDFFVNGTQVGTDLAFNSPASGLARIELFQTYAPGGSWDEIRMW